MCGGSCNRQIALLFGRLWDLDARRSAAGRLSEQHLLHSREERANDLILEGSDLSSLLSDLVCNSLAELIVSHGDTTFELTHPVRCCGESLHDLGKIFLEGYNKLLQAVDTRSEPVDRLLQLMVRMMAGYQISLYQRQGLLSRLERYLSPCLIGC